MYKFLHFLFVLRFVYSEDPIVETKLGAIRGLRSESGYSMYLGVPYAVIDEERPFSAAVPHEGFNETFNAQSDAVVCPRVNGATPVGQIQCLTQHIYVPDVASPQNRLPVMVYFHGGAFVWNAGGLTRGTPEYFLEKGVIFIGVNYRLQMYGFFCTDSPKAPGNNGLKDQLEALRWIKENIESFGGDPNRVTIFGESAGGMSVHLHILSPHEQLFRNAIIQSGASGSPFGFVELDNSLALRVASYLGYVTDNVDDAIDFISQANVHEAALAAHRLRSTTIYDNEPLTKPCTEKEFEGIERFVPVNPNAAIPEKARNIPVMIGYNSQEMIFLHGNRPAQFFENYSIRDLLSFGMRVDGINETMIDIIRQFYIGDEPFSVDLVNEITTLASDFVWNHPANRAIKAMTDVGATVYHYLFSYVGSPSRTQTALDIDGVSHGAEVRYLFKSDTSFPNRTSDDEVMIERMVTMWTNFAKYGNPTPDISELLPVKWEPVTKDFLNYLNIDTELALDRRPFHDRMTFWDLFYETNYKQTIWYNGD